MKLYLYRAKIIVIYLLVLIILITQLQLTVFVLALKKKQRHFFGIVKTRCEDLRLILQIDQPQGIAEPSIACEALIAVSSSLPIAYLLGGWMCSKAY